MLGRILDHSSVFPARLTFAGVGKVEQLSQKHFLFFALFAPHSNIQHAVRVK